MVEPGAPDTLPDTSAPAAGATFGNSVAPVISFMVTLPPPGVSLMRGEVPGVALVRSSGDRGPLNRKFHVAPPGTATVVSPSSNTFDENTKRESLDAELRAARAPANSP